MDYSPVKASVSQASLTHIVRSEDLNMHGNLFGGHLLALMDNCAAITAMRHARRNCVTVSISDVAFLAPVHLGNIINVRARAHFTARTSVEILVTTERELHLTGDRKEVCRALFNFVALDDDNEPTAIPPVELETDEDRRLNAQAKVRYDARKRPR